MDRDAALAGFSEPFDVLIIGGGATGLGSAVDAAARGYRTALIEASDFAKATSSRSTKLVHGGVRYLRSGEIGLVREALRERSNLLRNAPHLVRDLPFIVPALSLGEIPYYAIGIGVYDLLAGRSNLPHSSVLTVQQALDLIPGLNRRGLCGAILYHDGQFDDARLALTLARTAVDCGASVANYMRAERLLYDRTKVCGVVAIDRESGRELEIRARAVVNATGIFVDAIRSLDGATANLLTHSRGTHIVVPQEILGSSTHAIIVPRTPDGRVVFMTPWHDHVIIGTTDVPAMDVTLDVAPTPEEITYIIQTVNPILARPITRRDASAVFAGLRPLVNRRMAPSAKLSREHIVEISRSGLVTITGGKWTTYRKMAEDAIDAAVSSAGLTLVRSRTAMMPLHGSTFEKLPPEPLRQYGADAPDVVAIVGEHPAYKDPFHPRLPYTLAQVAYAARVEMARTVDDVLARRTQALFLDAAAARESAPVVARLLAQELRRDEEWQLEQLHRFAEISKLAEVA